MGIKWERTLTVYVDVPDSWLDFDNLDSETDRKQAWDDLLSDLKTSIQHMYTNRNGYTRTEWPTFDLDWEDKPESKEA